LQALPVNEWHLRLHAALNVSMARSQCCGRLPHDRSSRSRRTCQRCFHRPVQGYLRCCSAMLQRCPSPWC